MDKTIEARQAINTISQIKISFNDMIVKACSMAIEQHPQINSSWLDDRIRFNDHIHIGVAMAVENGLLVPVVRFADQLTLQEISKDSLLINAARGELIDTPALLDLFRRGFGPNVVCDVWEGEPSISQDLLKNVRIGTPHVAGYSYDGKVLGTMMLSKALYSFLCIEHDPESICLDPPNAVKILSGTTSADTARNILRGFYRIDKDDDNLRGSLTGNVEQDSFSFDRLRSNYYERREAYGSSILDTGLELHQLTMARGLGCKVLSDH